MPSLPLCVFCRQRPAEPRWRPFCSDRCKMADLGRWLSGDYRVPDDPETDDGLDLLEGTDGSTDVEDKGAPRHRDHGRYSDNH